MFLYTCAHMEIESFLSRRYFNKTLLVAAHVYIVVHIQYYLIYYTTTPKYLTNKNNVLKLINQITFVEHLLSLFSIHTCWCFVGINVIFIIQMDKTSSRLHQLFFSFAYLFFSIMLTYQKLLVQLGVNRRCWNWM